MTTIQKRLEKIEERLKMNDEPLVVILRSVYNPEGIKLPENSREWLTYRQARENMRGGIIVLQEWDEILARSGQRNATKGNKNSKSAARK